LSDLKGEIMKKFLINVFLIVITCSLVSSCATKNKNESETGLNIGFVYLGPIGDGGWNYAHNQGKIEIEDLPFINNINYRENASDTDKAITAIEELIKEGSQLIFTTSYNHKEATIQMAKKYPDVIFESCSTFIKDDNLGSYFGRIYQAWYLAGITAGLKTESNKIGVIVALANPECIRVTNAFALGVKKINPKATIYLEWNHSWYNPSKENLIANKMINMGCDVITHNTDASESQRVADSKNVFSIGYNTDMKDFAPKKNLVSVVWNWGKLYKDIATQVYKGIWKPEITYEGIDSGYFGLSELSQHISSKEQEEINDFKQQIISKELSIFAGAIYDNKGNLRVKAGEVLNEDALFSIDWLVDGIKVLNPIATKE